MSCRLRSLVAPVVLWLAAILAAAATAGGQEAPAAAPPTASPQPTSAPDHAGRPAPSKSADELGPAEREPDVGFVPTPDTVVVEMLRVARVTEHDLLYDLGSGDGRIVITAAKRLGTRGVGIDIDPQRVREARAAARKAGVADRVTFLQQDLFESDFREASVVTLYLLPELNLKLRPTLLNDLRPGTRVVSHGFDMGDWEPDSLLTVDFRTVLFWVVPASVQGTWRWSLAGPAGALEAELQLTQRFQKVSGTLRVGGEPLRLTELRLRGDRLTVGAQGAVGGRRLRLELAARVEGDTLRGEATVKSDGSVREQAWKAERHAKARPGASAARAARPGSSRAR